MPFKMANPASTLAKIESAHGDDGSENGDDVVTGSRLAVVGVCATAAPVDRICSALTTTRNYPVVSRTTRACECFARFNADARVGCHCGGCDWSIEVIASHMLAVSLLFSAKPAWAARLMPPAEPKQKTLHERHVDVAMSMVNSTATHAVDVIFVFTNDDSLPPHLLPASHAVVDG
jgi:hypothetical protein